MSVPPAMPKPGLFRRTPPAVFPPIFGLMGLGLAWRRAADAFGMPVAIGDAILGAVTLFYLFAVLAYLAKLARRPGALVDDMKTLPGRAGLASGTMTGMLLAFVLAPMNLTLAKVVLVLAVAGHAVLLAIFLTALLRGPAEVRKVTPVWHLTLVGFIVSVMGALSVGWQVYGFVVFLVSVLVAVGVWAVSLNQLTKAGPPAPLRPTLAIHLAPASLLGISAYLLGMATTGLIFGGIAIVILLLLLIRGRWITEAGFSPFWGAFTFPLAAFSNLMQIMGSAGVGEVFRILGGLALVVATLFIPWIAYKVTQMWAKGTLAAKSNAAEA